MTTPRIPTTTTLTPTKTRPNAPVAVGVAVAVAGVVAAAASRADQTIGVRVTTTAVTAGTMPTDVNPPAPRPANPTTPTATPKTTTEATTTGRMAPPVVADAVAAASPVPAMTLTMAHRRTTRPTPWCTSGNHEPTTNPTPRAAPATPRSRASTARPGWRPNDNAAATGATPDGAARRS